MPRPRFSEFLSSRRRQLGLSIAQAARVLRLKDQVLIAFEEGDWDRIPRSGYAQGMLSSYARYLGLNPREVIDLFQEDLAAYAHGRSGGRHADHSSAYGDDPVYELPNTTTSSPRQHGPQDKDLYGSAGPAGSILTGASVSGTYLSHSPASSPLVNGRSAGYSDRYLQENGIAPQRTSSMDGRSLRSGNGQGRPYTGRAPRSSQRRQNPARAPRQRTSRTASDAQRLSSEPIQTRRSGYDDDLRYGQARPYELASTTQGRNASHNIVQPQRPNVRRRTSSEQRRSTRDRRPQKPPKSGVLGVVEAWFSDPRRTMVTVFVAVAAILLAIIIFSVKSCSSTPEADNKTQIPVTQTTDGADAQKGDEAEADATKDDEAAQKDDGAAAEADKDKDADKAEPLVPVEVKVKLADGAVSWVEVQNGGDSLVAGTLTGPWEKTFTANGTLTVRANDPTAVEVTANGEPVQFETMVSGIGTATVEGPTADELAAQQKQDAAAKPADGSGSKDAAGSQKATTTNANGVATSTGSDEGVAQ